MTSTNTQTIERLAAETVAIMRGRIVDAIRYCEAYEGTDRTIVLDGSMYAPSMRALPNGERAWTLSFDADDADLWQLFVDITDELETVEVEDGRTDAEYPDMWTVGWDEGCLFAYAPEYAQVD